MKLSTRKLSILGIVLLAASAVTAAVVPSKAKDANANANNGHLTDSSGGSGVENTCRAALTGDALDCDYSQTGAAANQSSTSGAGSNASTSTSFDNGNATGTGTTA